MKASDLAVTPLLGNIPSFAHAEKHLNCGEKPESAEV